jgi:hypothetical protein
VIAVSLAKLGEYLLVLAGELAAIRHGAGASDTPKVTSKRFLRFEADCFSNAD